MKNITYKTYRIANICSMIKGSYPTLSTEPGEYPLVVTAEYRRSASSYQLEGPAVCIPLISSTGHGDATMHRIHYQEGKFALASLLVALLPNDPDLCDAKYLYYLLTVKKNQYFVPLMSGTANVSLKVQDIESIKINLPPLEEQQRIVARIEELAAKIEEARGLRREAEEEINYLKVSTAGTLFVLADNKTWPIVTLGDVADIHAGVTLGRVLYGPTIDLPYLRVANVQDGYLDLNVVKTISVLVAESEKWQLQYGDILLTEGGDWDKLGRGAVWRGEIANCIHQNHVFCVRTDPNEFEPDFLVALFSSPYGKSYFQSASKKTTNLASINQKQLKAFKVFRPSLPEQRLIVARLEDLQSKVDTLKRIQAASSAELDALLPSILDKAFKGEL